MTEEQFEQLLAALSDLQVSLDAVGMDVEDLRKAARKDRDERLPGWVTRASRLSDGLEDEGYAATTYQSSLWEQSYDPFGAAGYVVIAALAASAATALFMLFLVGG